MATEEKESLPLFGDEASSLERELAAERRQAFPMWEEREAYPSLSVSALQTAETVAAQDLPEKTQEQEALAEAESSSGEPAATTEAEPPAGEPAALAEPPASAVETPAETPSAEAPAQEAAQPERVLRTLMTPPPALKPTVTDAAGESFGEYLRRLREENHFTIDELASETRIKCEYLTALEREDFAALPAPVYVMGYVRKLGTLYQVPEARLEEVTEKLREQLEYELPDDINKSVIDREVSEESERKLHQLTMIFAVAAILIVAALVAGGLLLIRTIGKSQVKETWQEPESQRILDLAPVPKLKNERLAIPKD